MAWRLVAYSSYISIVVNCLCALVVLWIVNRKINPSYKLAWTILVLMVPIFGVTLYLLFGESRIASATRAAFEQKRVESREYLKEKEETRQKLDEEDFSISKQSAYITKSAGYPVHENTSAEYFQVGDGMCSSSCQRAIVRRRSIFLLNTLSLI